MRRLNNNNQYQALDQHPTSAFCINPCRSLEAALEVGLTDHELKVLSSLKLLSQASSIPCQNNKDFDTIPSARPIVSANGSVTDKLSLFIDRHIKPHVSSLPSYVQDDMDFLLQNV